MSPIEKLSSTPNPAVLLFDFESAPAGLEESLAETLGAVVKLSANSKGKGRIVIEFTNLDQLEGIVHRIQQQGH